MLTPDYPIRTARLDLRPFEPTDLAALHAYRSRPDVVRYLYEEPDDEAATRASLERRLRRTALRTGGDALNLAVVVRETGRLVGDVMLAWTSAEHRQGEIGYVFHPAAAGRGYATEAAAEMLRLGFEWLGLHRVVGRLDARNTASARVLERLGMRREAHLVQNEFVKGEWTDEAIYALLAAEWRAADGAADVASAPDHAIEAALAADRGVDVAPAADHGDGLALAADHGDDVAPATVRPGI
ncbi:GNAT family N-acetyltransferase [Plantactinospora siamensis]|uniref:GNAT family N-acetyltransferase n=1 Tax=Plantactinospora siamensis TaxID=555372 RepID=A0ABV6P1B5_9ACTN